MPINHINEMLAYQDTAVLLYAYPATVVFRLWWVRANETDLWFSLEPQRRREFFCRYSWERSPDQCCICINHSRVLVRHYNTWWLMNVWVGTCVKSGKQTTRAVDQSQELIRGLHYTLGNPTNKHLCGRDTKWDEQHVQDPQLSFCPIAAHLAWSGKVIMSRSRWGLQASVRFYKLFFIFIFFGQFAECIQTRCSYVWKIWYSISNKNYLT